MPVFRLNRQPFFPPTDLAEESGLIAVGGDLKPDRLIAAYSQGIFPWYSEGDPLLWWFTTPRLVLFPEEFRIPKRLARTIRQKKFAVTFDTAFAEVISSCASSRPNREETWIVDDMMNAYIQLHELGYAHSVECWKDDELAGGLYGIRLDRMFFGESMFTHITDGSKIALVALVEQLKEKDVKLIDCQMTTQHLVNLGARELLKEEFQDQINSLINTTYPDGKWTNDDNQTS